MSYTKLLKRARNLRRELPAFLAMHPGGTFTEAACQDLCSKIEGYPNPQIAKKAMDKSGAAAWSDAIATFYSYPWGDIDPHRLKESLLEGDVRLNLLTGMSEAQAKKWLEDRSAASGEGAGQRLPDGGIVLIDATRKGADGLLDELVGDGARVRSREGRELGGRRAETSFCSISQHRGVRLDLFSGWARSEIVAGVREMLRPVSSAQQLAVCEQVLETAIVSVISRRLKEREYHADLKAGKVPPLPFVSFGKDFEEVPAVERVDMAGLSESLEGWADDDLTAIENNLPLVSVSDLYDFVLDCAEGCEQEDDFNYALDDRVREWLRSLVDKEGSRITDRLRPLVCLFARLLALESAGGSPMDADARSGDSLDFTGTHTGSMAIVMIRGAVTR